VRRLLGVAAIACAVAALPSRQPPPVAAAAAENRAVVVVDTGQEVRHVCVRFAEDFLTGQELLIRARTDPVFRQYSGLGTAVCALCGVGCPADDSCLTCGGDTYWAYSRAPQGTSEFKLSGGGASSTKVYDGDVEGWRWSKGLLPAYASVDQVCGPAMAAAAGSTTSTAAAAPATTTTAAPPHATTPSEAGRVGGVTAGAGAGTTTSPSTSSTVRSTTGTSLATEDEVGGRSEVGGRDDAAAPPTIPTAADDSGNSPLSMLAFAAALAALIAWAAWLRRVRGRSAPAD
jgi:hypothetical protein